MVVSAHLGTCIACPCAGSSEKMQLGKFFVRTLGLQAGWTQAGSEREAGSTGFSLVLDLG